MAIQVAHRPAVMGSRAGFRALPTVAWPALRSIPLLAATVRLGLKSLRRQLAVASNTMGLRGAPAVAIFHPPPICREASRTS
jgi:hypothetical protein